MTEEDINRYFKILELTSDASLPQIKKSYQYLKKLYVDESMVTLPVKEDISEEYKKEILQQIEEAYNRLLDLFEKAKKKSDESAARLVKKDIDKFVFDINMNTFSGHVLKQIREKLNIELNEIAFATKIGKQCIKDIESETYSALPPVVYLRGYLSHYANYLSLDPKRVIDDYMEGYYEWKNEHKITD